MQSLLPCSLVCSFSTAEGRMQTYGLYGHALWLSYNRGGLIHLQDTPDSMKTNCHELSRPRKQHRDSWWSCKMASVPLRSSHVPAAVNEWTHTETLLKYKNVNRTDFSLFLQLVWQFWGYHSPYLCFTSPAAPTGPVRSSVLWLQHLQSHSVPMLLIQNMRPLCLDQVGQD